MSTQPSRAAVRAAEAIKAVIHNMPHAHGMNTSYAKGHRDARHDACDIDIASLIDAEFRDAADKNEPLRAAMVDVMLHLEALSHSIDPKDGSEYCGACDWKPMTDTPYPEEMLDHRRTCPLVKYKEFLPEGVRDNHYEINEAHQLWYLIGRLLKRVWWYPGRGGSRSCNTHCSVGSKESPQ